MQTLTNIYKRYSIPLLIFSILVITAVNSITLKELIAIKHYSSPLVLFARGILSFCFLFGYGWFKKIPPLPKHWKVQRFRLITAGLSLLLSFYSYKYLLASTNSLMQRLDIPLLILFSLAFKVKKSLFQTFVLKKNTLVQLDRS